MVASAGRAKKARAALIRAIVGTQLAVAAVGMLSVSGPAFAQSYSFSGVSVEGNQQVDAATVVKLAGIPAGEAITAAALNDAYQRIAGSGLFESVELIPSGNTLIVRVVENRTINVVSFEGNRRVKDEVIDGVVKSESRRFYSPAQAEADAEAITALYAAQGRLAARVEPRVIVRPGNKVDLVFEIREGRVTEVESITFTGNRAFSDRRLRQVLETKQAGLLRNFVKRDTYVPERIDLDRQLLTEFYRSRGYIDAEVRGAASEFARDREGFFVTFTVSEGQKYTIANVSVASDYEGVEAADYQKEVRVRKGATYSPTLIENTIARMEGLGQRNGVTFLRVEPVITRNEGDGTLDVVFVLSKGPRVFVERIDIEGNATTLDQVIRRQFKTVEGDPLNPREIRQAAERIRALGYFKTADVNASQGSNEDQVIVDVNVEEQPTGSLSFGATYGATTGIGLNVGFSETNFLGRGQTLNIDITSGTDTQDNSILFIEPAFLNRDLKFRFAANYNTSEADNEDYNTRIVSLAPSIEFPVGEQSRLELRFSASEKEMSNYTGASALIAADTAQGALLSTSIGYSYTFDNRITGLNPNGGFRLRFGQDFAGLGGDVNALTTSVIATTERKVFQDDVTLRAEFEGGFISSLNGTNTRVIDRFSGNGKIRGFEPNGIGPRDLSVASQDALGGNYFAVARLEAEFPLGLPEEYGITGGLFADMGSVWGLDNPGTVDDSLHIRSSVGFSIFWNTPIGPLRFNFSRALEKQSYDQPRDFDLTISTRF